MPTSCLHRAQQGLAHAPGTWEISPLLSVRIRRVPAGDALDRCLQVEKTMLLDERRELGAEAARARGLVDDHAAAGLFDRSDDRVQIEWPKIAQIDDLAVDADLSNG